MLRNFKRGELLIKKWNLLKNQMAWIGQSSLEINRDSVYIIVKDTSKKVKEDLTDEQIKKWGGNGYLDWMRKKEARAKGFNNNKDELFIAVGKNKPSFDKPFPGYKEKGIKIQVGPTKKD